MYVSDFSNSPFVLVELYNYKKCNIWFVRYLRFYEALKDHFFSFPFLFISFRLVSGRLQSRNPVVSGSSPSLTIEKKLDFLRVR